MKLEILFALICCNMTQFLTVDAGVEDYEKMSAGLTEFPSDIPKTITKRIKLDDNAISTIPDGALAGMTVLFSLSMPNNLLTTFPNLCDVGNTLASASMFTNKITSVPEDHIRCLTVLRNIHLGNNMFLEFPDLSVLGASLTSFYFNHNHRVESISKNILSKLTRVEYLDFSWCNFDEDNLITLGFNSSQLIHLPLNNNNISHFPEIILENIDRLVLLKLGSNPYQSIPRITPVKSTVKELYFDGYGMIAVPDGYLSGMNQLTKISLQTCELKTWPLALDDVATTIEKIIMPYNQIQRIPVLKSMPKLTTLSLEFNELTAIPENAFKEAPLLTHLKLEGNKLQTLYDLGTNVLRSLYLDGNPLVCDCRLTWLKTLTEENNVDISDSGNPVNCMDPEGLTGLDFKIMTKGMMCADSGIWYRNLDVMDNENATTVDQPALITDDCALLCLSCTECRAFDMEGPNLQCRLYIDDPNKCEKERSGYFMKYV